MRKSFLLFLFALPFITSCHKEESLWGGEKFYRSLEIFEGWKRGDTIPANRANAINIDGKSITLPDFACKDDVKIDNYFGYYAGNNRSRNGSPELYVVNYSDSAGALIISANEPYEIYAYIDRGSISPEDLDNTARPIAKYIAALRQDSTMLKVANPDPFPDITIPVDTGY